MQECPRCGKQAKDGIRFCPDCGAGLATWTGRLRAGDTLIERYTIVRPLARGGMGAVYIATDKRLGDVPVAVKEMTPHHAPGDTEAWERAVQEFRREAALLARLSHPNLPHVIDQFQRDEHEFLVMELVPGHTLRAELEQRTEPVPLEQALAWFKQLASVLQYLHEQSPPIIYRDLKPTNIMLRPDGRVVLIDFGIARLYKPEQTSDTAVYGTPGYAPPEQYGLGQTDVRTDVFALAMVLHEVLTGFEPAKRQSVRPPLAHSLRPEVPERVSAAIQRALAVDPDDRFASIADFVAAVEEPADAVVQSQSDASAAAAAVAVPTPSSAPVVVQRRFWPWVLAGMLLLSAIVGTLLWLNRAPATIAGGPTATPTDATTTTPTSVSTPEPTAIPLPGPPGMVTVPAGTFIMGSADGQPDEQPAGPGYLPTFYIDRTEVTNAEYRECVAAERCTAPQKTASLTRSDYYTNTAYADFPVIWVTWDQAHDYCAWADKRLPTEAEWEKAARGSEGLTFPWGNTSDPALANLWGDTAGGDTVAVGSYPDGASPFGALDMVGNVWEWTSSLDQPYPYNSSDGRELANQPGPRIVRGGAWGDNPLNARASDRDRRQPNDPNDNLGFRCATSQPFQPAGMDFVPSGTWRMGATAAEAQQWEQQYSWPSLLNEQPATNIDTPAFFIDHTEVTNADYAAFISATDHPLPQNPFDPVGLAIWQPDGTFPLSLTTHPVVNVTWNDARAYCAWANKRLPTEAEWEKVARSTSGRLWPWGDEWDASRANTAEAGPASTTPAGSYPDGAGPYGTLDLAGNVWEWTSSLYQPYPYDSTYREAPSAAGARVIRGGSWMDNNLGAHATGRNSLLPNLANVNVGFRCALSVDSP